MAYVWDAEKTHRTTFQKSVAILKPNLGFVEPRFLYYLLLGENRRLTEFAGGTAQKNLLLRDMRNFSVLVPTKEIQRRIVSILSAYDDLIDANTRRIAILEEIARRFFDEWFVNLRFPSHQTAALTDTVVGQLPPDWSLKGAKEIIEFDPATSVSKEGEKPFVPMTSLSPNTMVISDVELRSGNSGSKFQPGDTLFARITPCLENGKTGFVEFLNDGEVGFGSTEFIVMRGRSVSPEWVYLFARSELFRAHAIKSMSGATGRQRVRRESLEAFPLAEPASAIMEQFTNIVRPMFEEIHILARANNNLQQARDLLLPKLISGEIDLSDAEVELAADRAAAE
jgi:type I restriction enzyme S subunit